MTNKAAAHRYARALLDVAVAERADLEQIERQLADFASLLPAHPALAKVLLNPAVPTPRKRAAVAELTKQAQVVPILSKLLAMLADRDRLVILPDLVTSYREKLADYRKIVRAEVTTAAPLSADRAQQIQRSLSEATGRQVTMETRVDPAMIGGVVAKVGSIVYDASVARQLQRMKERLVERL